MIGLEDHFLIWSRYEQESESDAEAKLVVGYEEAKRFIFDLWQKGKIIVAMYRVYQDGESHHVGLLVRGGKLRLVGIRHPRSLLEPRLESGGLELEEETYED